MKGEGEILTRVDVFITGNDLAAIPLLTGLHVESYSGGRFLFHHPQTGFKFNFGIAEPETPGRQASEDVSEARLQQFSEEERRRRWSNLYVSLDINRKSHSIRKALDPLKPSFRKS